MGLFSIERSRSNKRAMAFSAAAMYAGAAFVGIAERFTAGGPEVLLLPGLAALGITAVLLAVGPRLPLPVLASAGPLGAALIALALSDTHAPGDGAILYVWPVLWMAYFFGAWGTITIVAWVGLVHGLALISLPSELGYLDRWIDVMSVVGVVGVVVHVLSRHNAALLARVEEEARVDQLTGLLNRRGFEERAAIELQRARRENAALGIASFDIDYFKRINDEWGHDVGDRVLEQLSAVFSTQARGSDVIARMGGEEFVALLPTAGVEETKAYADRVRTAFSASGESHTPRATISAGVTAAVAPDDTEALINVADAALYAAKRAGRDRTVVDTEPWTAPPSQDTAPPAAPDLGAESLSRLPGGGRSPSRRQRATRP